MLITDPAQKTGALPVVAVNCDQLCVDIVTCCALALHIKVAEPYVQMVPLVPVIPTVAIAEMDDAGVHSST